MRKTNMIRKRVCLLLRSRQGSMFPLSVAVCVFLLLLFLGITEYMRLVITAAGVKDALESAVVSVVNDNYNEVYHSIREGYAAGYEPSEMGFVPSVDYGDVYGRISQQLGLKRQGDKYVSTGSSGETEYELSGLTVRVSNTAFASPGGTYRADATIRMEVPVRFAGHTVANMTIDLKAGAAYRERF